MHRGFGEFSTMETLSIVDYGIGRDSVVYRVTIGV